jgi:hypothetical protein
MMMISTRRQENCPLPISLRQLKAKDSGVKAQGTLKISNLEMYMANTGLRMDSERRGCS